MLTCENKCDPPTVEDPTKLNFSSSSTSATDLATTDASSTPPLDDDGSFDGAPLARHSSTVAHKPRENHPALLGSVAPPYDLLPPQVRSDALNNGRVTNFSPGPTNLPRAVENKIAALFASPQNLTSLALSHRTPEFQYILNKARTSLRNVMSINEEKYEILFLHGGGHGQFAAVPLNLCPKGTEDVGTYVVSGTWGERSLVDGSKFCTPNVINTRDESTGVYKSFPDLSEDNEWTSLIDPKSKFVYLCSNETVNGVELHRLPVLPPHLAHIPLVVDASSDFTSKPIDFDECNVGILFACASKNIGHPGVTAVIVRRDLLGNCNPLCPTILDYTRNADSGNLYNTISTFNVEVVGLVMDWILEEGGVEEVERRSIDKSDLVYEAIDSSDGFYVAAPVFKGNRSRMNVPFAVRGGEVAKGTQRETMLTEEFLVRAYEEGMVGLRTLTPFGFGEYLRVSLYHGVDFDDVKRMVEFMQRFAKEMNSGTREP